MAFSSLSAQQRVMVLLELLGGPKFAAEMRTAAASSGLLGKTVETTGKQMQVASRRTFLATQALYTLRRYAFYGTLAVGAMGAAVIKLGFSYLSAMQGARVALGPVIKDHAVLEGYLNRLFRISKYSPFVIKDLVTGFRQLFSGLQGTGVTGNTIIKTIQSLTDLMSFNNKISPGAFQRVSLAIQHLAFAGRLTGYAVTQLSRDGIPIMRILNKEFGITGDQLHNISKMGIPASQVLAAINKYASSTPGVRGAAMRLSLHTFTGLMQVVRDSLSQVSGALIGGAYKGGQSWLYQIAKPGGPLDRLSSVGNKRGGTAALLFLSKQLTGGTGLGKGFMLLLSILQNIGRVFVRVVIPAWILGAHALILFYPSLKLINFALGFLARHGTIAKFVITALAAEFFITHGAILITWVAMRLFNLATLGSLIPIAKLIKFLILLKDFALAGTILRLKEFAFAETVAFTAGTGFGAVTYKNTGLLAIFIRWIYRGVTAMKAYRSAAIAAGFATVLGAGAITGGLGLFAFAESKTITTPAPKILGSLGGALRTNVVSSKGQTYIQSPGGGRLTRLPSNDASLSLGDIAANAAGNEHWQPIVIQVDKQKLADTVARARQDKQARR